MSYLGGLRLHFAGQFQANVSTVNNDPNHFNNAAFKPEYQLMQQGDQLNGWFNPEGDAAFRLRGCRITAAFLPSAPVPASDLVFSCAVADSDGRVSAKLVDLDPEQQLVSQIWGLQVRIADSQGRTLLRGEYEPAAFLDIWDRATGAGSSGDVGAGATYQSVLGILQWGDVSASSFLSALKQAANTDTLSIKFNVDGINFDYQSPDFMCGRIVGTIGPAAAGEPHHMVVGRQFMAAAAPQTPDIHFLRPLGGINFCPAVVDAATSRLYLDLGNALSTTKPGGPMNDLGDLTVRVSGPGQPRAPATLGVIPAADYTRANWYETTAGVVVLPLNANQLQGIAASPLEVSGAQGAIIREWSSGAFVRADQFVYRLSPGQSFDIPIHAMRWGQPFAGASVGFTVDPSQLQVPPDQPPDPATLKFNATALTDGTGRANLTVRAEDPGTPRFFGGGGDYGIDGQVYGIRAAFTDPALNVVETENQWNFVSFLVWSGFQAGNPVTWNTVKPIFQQYANLYPVMKRFFDMGDCNAVRAHAHLLLLAFELDPADANSMPVTRDLSPAKRAAIVSFLKGPQGGPCPPAPAPMEAMQTIISPATVRRPDKGGKAAAAARRLVRQNRRGDAS